MARRLQFGRFYWLAGGLLVGFCLLVARLVYIQAWQHEKLLAIAQMNTQREFLIEPRRGDILDVQGQLLATSIFVKTVCADPTLVGNRQAEVARVLAPLM